MSADISKQDVLNHRGYRQIKWMDNFKLNWGASILFQTDLMEEISLYREGITRNPLHNTPKLDINPVIGQIIGEKEAYEAKTIHDGHIMPFLAYGIKTSLIVETQKNIRKMSDNPLYIPLNADELESCLLRAAQAVTTPDYVPQKTLLTSFHKDMTEEKFTRIIDIARTVTEDNLEGITKAYALDAVQDVSRIFHEFQIGSAPENREDVNSEVYYHLRSQSTVPKDLSREEALQEATDNLVNHLSFLEKNEFNFNSRHPRHKYIEARQMCLLDEYYLTYYLSMNPEARRDDFLVDMPNNKKAVDFQTILQEQCKEKEYGAFIDASMEHLVNMQLKDKAPTASNTGLTPSTPKL